MAKYVYPALFSPNELGGYCVSFPDVRGVYTEGTTLAEAMEMAQDALCLMLYHREIHGEKIIAPTQVSQLQSPENGIVTLIACDTNFYRRYFADKSVKKTVTIPAKLNLEAERAGLNFSQALRDGLENQLRHQGSP